VGLGDDCKVLDCERVVIPRLEGGHVLALLPCPFLGGSGIYLLFFSVSYIVL